ncbi:MAG: CinA family nicotinamide mononucleotide deamidase-related protein [Nitrospinae bacterium]|nr:CinA family nicotinamide mononucleotide deamidase-related protein [Nitrospinota bacterium]
MSARGVIILTVGDEVASGHTVNTNAAWMARALEGVGLTPERVVTLRDDERAIAAEFRSAARRYAVILVTGGLGPTSDDVTKPALCRAFTATLRRDPRILRQVRAFFRKRGYTMAPVNEGQADVPEGFTAAPNPDGTAPMLVKEGGAFILFAMPGVPGEMRAFMERHVLPALKKRFPPRALYRTVLRTAGIGESRLFTMIQESGGVDPTVEVAYLPRYGQVDVRLTVTEVSPKAARAAVERAARKLRKLLAAHIYAEGDAPLEAAVGETLAAQQLTLASAESCTGGLFAARITSVAGASRYFMDGVIAYSNESKVKRLGVRRKTLQTHGAVSAQVAAQMARGVRRATGADIGVAATGVAGPTGGARKKPVGLVYLALSHHGVTDTRRLTLGIDRQKNQERAAAEMLRWLWETFRE